MDCHGAGGDYTFNSLVADLLDPDCEFVIQSEWTEYTTFLEEGCDAALFVGMHAMAGRPDGVVSHRVGGGRASGASAPAWARPTSTPRCAATGIATSCSSPATAPSAASRSSFF